MTNATTTTTESNSTSLTGSCPECAGAIHFQRAPLPSEIVPCRECGVDLEVLRANPLALALAPEVEEDWGE